MQQERLFLENWREALRHAVLALGGMASVGMRLWPGKTPKQAETKLANCLNPDHDFKLDLEEIETIMRWARQEGVHCAMHQLADDLDYERPAIRAAKTAQQIIAEKRIRLAEQMKALADEEAALEREQIRSFR